MRSSTKHISVDNPSTVEDGDDSPSRSSGKEEALALVIAWCADEPWRVGEIAWLPRGEPGETRVLGRGAALRDDPHPRMTFVRQRPLGPEAVAPLLLPKLSRVQLLASSQGLESIAVRNVGRCALLVAGAPADTTSVSPGHTIQIGQQLLLLCVRRPIVLPRPDPAYPIGPFASADGMGIVGESAAVWNLRRQLAIVGPRSGHVLLLGPSGSGKELSARALHALSPRSHRPLVTRNAATIPDSLVDAELFGHARNYPNQGMPERIGLVGEADESTLFLDEIGELPPTLQAHLLRVLDAGEYHRLGEPRARKANLRVVAATNRDPSHLQEDLVARFAYRIEVPGLEARREDIALLVHHVLSRLASEDPVFEHVERGSSPHAAFRQEASIGLCRQLLEHSYATHFRELERLLLQSFVDAGGHSRRIPPLAERPVRREGRASPIAEKASSPDALAPARIQAVLDAHNGRIESAARALGLANRFALTRLITKHGLEVRRRPASGPGRTKGGSPDH